MKARSLALTLSLRCGFALNIGSEYFHHCQTRTVCLCVVWLRLESYKSSQMLQSGCCVHSAHFRVAQLATPTNRLTCDNDSTSIAV